MGAKIQVSGVVQGVGFRFFVYRIASRLGLTGYVKNLYDGGVLIEVEGDRAAVEELISQVKVGPRAAHVSDVKVEWKPFEGAFQDFDIW